MTEPIPAGRLIHLSPEFLTWLYFAVIADDGIVVDFNKHLRQQTQTAPDGAEIQIAIGGRVKLIASDGPIATLAGTGLSDNGEVLQAVARGAFVQELSFHFSLGHRVYSVTLKASGVVAVKLPDVFTDPDEDANATEVIDPLEKPKKKARPKFTVEDLIDLRGAMLDEVDDVVATLFAAFMAHRLNPAEWANDVASIRAAVADGLIWRSDRLTSTPGRTVTVDRA